LKSPKDRLWNLRNQFVLLIIAMLRFSVSLRRIMVLFRATYKECHPEVILTWLRNSLKGLCHRALKGASLKFKKNLLQLLVDECKVVVVFMVWRFTPIFGLALCLLLTSCGDYRGASEPYSFAPRTAESLWIPPKSIRREPVDLTVKDLDESAKESLSLAEVIDVALHNNPQTQESWAQAREAAASYGQSLQNYYILSNLTSSYDNYQEALFTSLNTANAATNVNNSNTTTSQGPNTFHGITYGSQLNLSYTVLDFGQTKATSQAALQALYQADFHHNQSLQTMVHQIMLDYYTYLSQTAQVQAAKQDVRNAEVALGAVLEKFNHGLADVGDKVQATTKLLEQKLNLVAAQKKQTLDYTLLLNDMGCPANAYVTFESYPSELKLFEIADLDTLLQLATQNRPELYAAEAAFKASEERLRAAKAQRYPVITSSLEAGREKANLGIGSYYDYDFSLNLSLPLFQGFFIQNGIKKAEATTLAFKAKLKEMQLNLVQEVTTYYNNVYYAKESYKYSKEFLASAQTDFQVNLEKYKVGTSTIVELINAQTAVANAQARLIQSEKDWYSSMASLVYAMGLLTNKPQEEVEFDAAKNCWFTPEQSL